MALGPVFVVMALFEGTRGLFAGWLKGVTMLALAPLFAVIGGSVMLELAVPVLSTLVATPGQVDAQAAMGFFMIGAVHVALMVLVLRTAATMVGGWTVFGLAPSESDRQDAPTVIHTSTPAAAAGQPATEQAQATSQVLAQARRIDIAAQPVAMPANDAGGSAQTAQARTTRVLNAASGAAPAQPGIAPISRAHGVGSRFRSANTCLLYTSPSPRDS